MVEELTIDSSVIVASLLEQEKDHLKALSLWKEVVTGNAVARRKLGRFYLFGNENETSHKCGMTRIAREREPSQLFLPQAFRDGFCEFVGWVSGFSRNPTKLNIHKYLLGYGTKTRA